MNKIVKEGIFCLNHIIIRYTLTNNYFNSDCNPVAHLEFESVKEKKKNAITNTGYKSHFFGFTSPDFDKKIESDYIKIVRDTILTYAEEKKIASLIMEEAKEKEECIQQSLF